ncbi:hypothetical protein [Paracoccus aerius]|uniref:Uncharacterized protein n=1 Tax=Paracoccus aerius TaxID=1915382 RepID=A0ABS1S9Y7_9RHOB|nr:hypothetical protein [Paracoccus aerius]MBL3675518.1 hypothetical protein [Paracoccus aerius]
MTDATVTLDGFERINGIVEIGGDYAQFRSPSEIAQDDITGPQDGLSIVGKSERVVLESYRVLDREEGEGREITLRRIKPEAS